MTALQPVGGDLAPVADDLSLYVRGGRLRSSAAVVPDAIEAERLGLSRLWLSERYDLKEAGALLGGMAATTSRLKLGTAALFPGSRNVLLTAALGATMHSAYGPRFTLGLGRSLGAYIQNANLRPITFAELLDYVDIIRRLWRGEAVDYDGPIGSFKQLHMADTYDGPAPEIAAPVRTKSHKVLLTRRSLRLRAWAHPRDCQALAAPPHHVVLGLRRRDPLAPSRNRCRGRRNGVMQLLSRYRNVRHC